ncbi:hypothetical protein FRAHR75_10089 [Frankia sp. Hr75.2]|nr:hypothetical protein FRAHR75_10089 [Frankia sp. Hr75.2]
MAFSRGIFPWGGPAEALGRRRPAAVRLTWSDVSTARSGRDDVALEALTSSGATEFHHFANLRREAARDVIGSRPCQQ